MPEFEAKLEPRGGGVAAVVPFDVKQELGRARAPVKVSVNGHTFRGGRARRKRSKCCATA